MGAGRIPPWLHFAGRVYSRDDMAHGTTLGAVHKAPPARVHAARRASLAGQSWGLFCRAAIMSVCHRLAQRLAGIDGGGGAKLDCRRVRRQKLTRLSARCSALMSNPLSILQGCLIGLTTGNGSPLSLGNAAY